MCEGLVGVGMQNAGSQGGGTSLHEFQKEAAPPPLVLQQLSPPPPTNLCAASPCFLIQHSPTHILLQASFAVSGVSLFITLIHQLLYCVPNWQQLVTVPLAASGLSTRTVLVTHAVYGLITAVHQYVQLRVLASHGAMSVGLVNAVRASVVSVVSSLLFCGVKPQLCLTFWRGASAVVVTLGAVQWVFAGEDERQRERKRARRGNTNRSALVCTFGADAVCVRPSLLSFRCLLCALSQANP